MKKTILLITMSLMTTLSYGQIVIGDMNGDGKVTVQDVTACANTVIGTRPIRKIPNANPYASDFSTLSGTWRSIAGNALTLNEDGTATDNSTKDVVAYEFYPFRGDILLLNQSNYVIKYYHLVRLGDNYIVLCQQGADDLICYYSGAIPVSNITLNIDSYSMNWGENIQLTATINPSNAIVPTLKWSSSDSRIASVNDSGYVTACGSGTCYIIASAIDGSNTNASCTITVNVDKNGHDAVDLGLSVKWSTMNIGAASEGEEGVSFAWGETETKSGNSWSNYKFCESTFSMNKYCVHSTQGFLDNKVVLEAEDDAAHSNWGGNWRMPTYQEFDELATKCTWTWVTNYKGGISGYLITSNIPGWTDKSIFLPAAGYNGGASSNYNVGSKGYYWTSTLNTSKSYNANYMYFDNKEYTWHAGERYYGQSVRPVCP